MLYNHGSNTRPVWFSNGRNKSGLWMLQFFNAIKNQTKSPVFRHFSTTIPKIVAWLWAFSHYTVKVTVILYDQVINEMFIQHYAFEAQTDDKFLGVPISALLFLFMPILVTFLNGADWLIFPPLTCSILSSSLTKKRNFPCLCWQTIDWPIYIVSVC